MICARCSSEYDRMEGVLRFKKDYGYCSVQCLVDDKPPCPYCGSAVTRHATEKLYAYAKRVFCSQRCAGIATASKPKSQQTRQRMSQAAKERPPEHYAKIAASRKKFDQTTQGKEARRRTVEGHRRWREANPKAFAEAAQSGHTTRLERGVYQENSERQKAFFQTPEGQSHKERMGRERSGKKRPPHIIAKAAAAAREFWDSPAGYKMRQEIAKRMSKGKAEKSPWSGPNWPKQASKARQRDGHVCSLCGQAKQPNGRRLDVHHIYPRRQYGYVPGSNCNYLWANHPANLITLCAPCHVRVERGIFEVQRERQERADTLWNTFNSIGSYVTRKLFEPPVCTSLPTARQACVASRT